MQWSERRRSPVSFAGTDRRQAGGGGVLRQLGLCIPPCVSSGWLHLAIRRSDEMYRRMPHMIMWPSALFRRSACSTLDHAELRCEFTCNVHPNAA